jgi:hypothetical protein
MPPSLEEITRRSKILWAGNLETTPSINLMLREKQSWQGIISNNQEYCQSALQLGMLLVRREDDLDGAMTTFARSLPQIDEIIALLDAGNSIREPTLLEMPLHMSVLCGDRTKALKLAALLEPMPVNGGEDWDGNWLEMRTRLFGALIQDDLPKFMRWFPVYARSKKPHLDLYLKAYFELYRAILQRDQPRYDLLILQVSKEFDLRGTDKKARDPWDQYGGGIENNFVVDFMALSVAALAHRHGMTTTLETVYFPQALYQRIITAQG